MTLWLRVLLFTFASLVISGCFNDREGEFVTHWITCRESLPASGGTGLPPGFRPGLPPGFRPVPKWVADRSFSNRFDIVLDSRYQVSFASQRVVSSTGPSEFKKCTVYDRKNWTCEDFDGSLLAVKDGSRPLSCSKASGLCFLEVTLISRAIILFRGVDEAERLCNLHSQAFESFIRMQP